MRKSFTRIGVSVWNFIPLLLRLSTYIIFVKNKISTPCSRKGLSTNCCFSVFVCLFCFALLAIFSQREFRTNTNRPSPSEKNSHFQTRGLSCEKQILFVWEWKIILISMTMHLASLWNRGLGQFGNGLLKSWLYCLLAMTKLLRKLGPNSSPKTVLQCTSTKHLQATPRPLHSNQGWSNAKAKTLHFPILDLRGGVGGGHKFPIYFVQDCSKLFSSTTSKSPI